MPGNLSKGKKLSTYDEVAGSSTGSSKKPVRDTDYEVALRLQQCEDEQAGFTTLHRSDNEQKSNIDSNEVWPEDIQDDIEEARAFASEIMTTTCHKCDADLTSDFSLSGWFQEWESAQQEHKKPSICAATCPKKHCRALTCLGCGNEPYLGKFKASFDSLTLDWCCKKGRQFAMWILLCRYDEVELDMQAASLSQTERNMRDLSLKGGRSKGIGYGRGSHHMYGNPFAYGNRYAPRQAPEPLHFNQADSKTDHVTKLILGLLAQLLNLVDGKPAPQGLSEMIELSLLQDRVAQLLRNDSIQDVAKRGKLYSSVLDFVEKLGRHEDTSFLICDKRFAKKRSAGLAAISSGQPIESTGKGGKGKGKSAAYQLLEVDGSKKNMSSSLVDCMQNLATQSTALLKTSQSIKKDFGDESGQAMLDLAKRISQTYKELALKTTKKRKGSSPTGKEAFWMQYHADNRVDYDARVLANLIAEMQTFARRVTTSPKGRIPRIIAETSEMHTSLPTNIFLKVDQVRPDAMKCLMVGPEGTPYEGGLFEYVFQYLLDG
ncbi:hypothetical protein MMC20_004516 [Loxospora ochrophaea]|nr:hypothetical protein [Loxospora ochrophaea]